MTKKKAATKTEIKPRNTMSVTTSEDDNHDEVTANVLTRPEVAAALTIKTWQPLHDVPALAAELTKKVDEVTNGSMARPEAMLLSQAHTLDELFNSLAKRAHCQTHMPNYETFLRLAFKAQAQCRSTLETLATIKNPPVIFAKQANISHGHQQINNGVPTQASHAEEHKNQPNELLVEAQYGSTTMDINTTGTAIPVNSHLEAVDKSRS